MSERTVVLELAGKHDLARDLVAGGVFVPGYDLAINEDCDLLLRGASEELRLAARVVWAGNGGIGLQLNDCDAQLKQRIAALASATEPAPPPAEAAAAAPAPAEAPPAQPAYEFHFDDAPAAGAAPPAQPAYEFHFDDEPAADGADTPSAPETVAAAGSESDAATAGTDETDGGTGDTKKSTNMHERLRGLSLAQQIKLAHHGEVSERIVLERMYGKNVWEALLRNPRLTGPEVARIARMGALPRTLMEIIVGNGAWLQIPEVRRALLTNPRLGTDQIMRVLRLLPKHELKIAAMQTAYPMAVRDAAKRMLKDA